MSTTTDDDCPICQGTLQNPSQPVPCCKKVFCQSCLKQAILVRPSCPHCRSHLTEGALAFRNAIRSGLQGSSQSLQTARNVSPNIRTLLNQLQAASAQSSQTASTPHGNLPNPVVSHYDYPASIIRRRPVPRPRIQPNVQVAPPAPVITAPNLFRIQANPIPQPDLQSDDPDDMDWQVQIAALEDSSNLGIIVRTYNCPYCQEGGLDDLTLGNHCNTNHRNDPRRVVCPVCVSLPHGNPTYCSRDFIGHLNLRHRYYIDDITNIYQTDEINLQDAIMRSWHQT